MIRDITLGQYYPTESVLHRLDPRVKLWGTLLYVMSLFLFQSFAGYIVASVFLVSLIIMSHVPVKFMLRGLKAVFVILAVTAVLNVFMTPGRVLVSFWKIKITIEGLRTAAFMVIRLVFLITGSSIMTLTTTPSDLTDGLEKGLGWLKIFRVPVHEIAMMMSIALTFIPVLLEETDRIMKAQQARGADFESGNIIRRAKALVPILVPLFVSAFRRANDLAIAMESRCYRGGEGRTKLNPLKYAMRDYAAHGVLLAYLAAIIAVAVIF
ncbi:MAG: energy-coupling factor transporter transmembrane protein EcfT [Lachnospiraceae bacterium]|nr:energy-coupling factor transporter transmembrane protein EcfT [Lachnospiraceae bacterium]